GVAANEGLDQLVCLIVRELPRWMLTKIRAWPFERSAESVQQGELAASNHVDGDSGGVRRVLHRQPQLHIHGNIAKQLPFHSDEADLVVLLPWHVVTGADVDVFILEAFGGDGLYRFRF